LADTAAASGFADQSHMTRIFTRHFGFTPGAWQRA
jgi:AraC-like DNA-binding protein